MKFKSVALFLMLLVFTNYIMSNAGSDNQPFRGEQLINSLMAKVAKSIKKESDMIPVGAGTSMPGGPIRKVTLCFDTKRPYNKNQLREFLIKFSRQLLIEINENKEIQEFLKERPFTIRNNVEIIIYNNEMDGENVYDPGISVARFSEGALVYRTTDVHEPLKYKNTYKESYEEALLLLKEENNL